MLNRRIEKRIPRLSGFVLAAIALLCGLPTTSAAADLPAALQMVVVTTEGWSSVDATLRLYERKGIQSEWTLVGEEIPAVVGRNGLAWGRGLHPEPSAAGGPQKKEGDGRAPAGLFRLGPAFGEAPGASLPGIVLPYRQMMESSRCVDDPASSLYNRLVEEGSVRKEWSSAEEMARSDGQYRLGIVIGHNTDPVLPGGGSCIFLHIRKSPARGTAGCTAVDGAALEELLRRLRLGATPLLVQLPRQEYVQWRDRWGLPFVY